MQACSPCWLCRNKISPSWAQFQAMGSNDQRKGEIKFQKTNTNMCQVDNNNWNNRSSQDGDCKRDNKLNKNKYTLCTCHGKQGHVENTCFKNMKHQGKHNTNVLVSHASQVFHAHTSRCDFFIDSRCEQGWQFVLKSQANFMMIDYLPRMLLHQWKCLTFIDYFSRDTWVCSVKAKSHISANFIKWRTMVRKQCSHPVKFLRSDH